MPEHNAWEGTPKTNARCGVSVPSLEGESGSAARARAFTRLPGREIGAMLRRPTGVRRDLPTDETGRAPLLKGAQRFEAILALKAGLIVEQLAREALVQGETQGLPERS